MAPLAQKEIAMIKSTNKTTTSSAETARKAAPLVLTPDQIKHVAAGLLATLPTVNQPTIIFGGIRVPK